MLKMSKRKSSSVHESPHKRVKPVEEEEEEENVDSDSEEDPLLSKQVCNVTVIL